MKQFQFESFLTEDQSVRIPLDIACQIDRGRPVQVVLLVQDDAEDADWARFTAEQFLKGYAPEDGIYDDLQTR